MSTVLLVEDDPDLRNELRERLVQAGYGVLAADGGARALGLLKDAEKDVTVAVTDIVMAEGEGIELILALRRERPDLFIVAMSGKGPYLQTAQRLGADRTLLKPFRFRALLDCLETPARARV